MTVYHKCFLRKVRVKMYETKQCTKKCYQEYTPCNLSLYEYLVSKSEQFGELTALSFYGKETTYEELFEQIELTERSLRALGIGKNDIVAVSLPGTPEAVSVLYAINKIGAVYCAFDCRAQEDEILEMLKKFDPKLCIVPNFQLKAFKNVTDRPIVYIHPAHSIYPLSLIEIISDFFTGRLLLRLRRKNIITYSDFIKRGEAEEPLPAQISTDNIFGYFYTSGTTYGRKSIILTNENVNSSVYQSSCESYMKVVNIGDTMLNIMPLFTCYGVTNAVHLPLSLGVTVKLVPLINTKKLKKLLLREKPNFMISVPAHWEYFQKEVFDGCDLSFLKIVVVGGDKIDPSYETRINEIFKKCGSNAFLRIGYGMSETTSIGTMPEIYTPKGSVGLPAPCMRIKICDSVSTRELSPYEHGEICMIGPNVCKGYYKDDKMTDMLLRYHSDGKLWLHSGDVGYVDENGNLFFCERMKHMYVRFDGTKISPYTIEKILATSPIVERCMVAAVKDTQHTHGMCPKAVIVLKDGVKEVYARQHLKKFAHEHLGQHMIPKEYVFVDKLPYTKNGKLDYARAAQMSNF